MISKSGWLPVNTVHRANVVFKLGQRRRRWPNFNPTLVQCSCLRPGYGFSTNNVGLMLAQRLWRWASISPTLGQRLAARSPGDGVRVTTPGWRPRPWGTTGHPWGAAWPWWTTPRPPGDRGWTGGGGVIFDVLSLRRGDQMCGSAVPSRPCYAVSINYNGNLWISVVYNLVLKYNIFLSGWK